MANYMSVPAVAGVAAPASRAIGKAGPVTAEVAVVSELVSDVVEYASLILPLVHMVQAFRPSAVSSETPRCFSLQPTGSGYVLGDFAIGNVNPLEVNANDAADVSASAAITFTFTDTQDAEFALGSYTLTEPELVAMLTSLVRILTTGPYAAMPQIMSALDRGGWVITAEALQLITEATSDSTFRVASAAGLDSRPSYRKGVISNPTTLSDGAVRARAIAATLAQTVWPTLAQWLDGDLDVDLNAITV